MLKKQCTVCSDTEKCAPYKCPTCRIAYCSVGCWKIHKSGECKPPDPPPQESESKDCSTKYEFPTEDTIPPEKLELLKNSSELKNVLKNRHVRDILNAIDKSTNPSESIKHAMLEPIFVEFADACLKVVQPEDELVGD